MLFVFSENHSLSLSEMEVDDIKKVVDVWRQQYEELGSEEYINHVQIFENKRTCDGLQQSASARTNMGTILRSFYLFENSGKPEKIFHQKPNYSVARLFDNRIEI